MLHVDQKYVSLLGPRLRNFRRVGRHLYQFSCPFCGDSRRDRRKARGYAYERAGSMLVYCHRCGKSTNTYGLLRHMDEDLLAEYVLERFEAENGPRPEFVPDEHAGVPAEKSLPGSGAGTPGRLAGLPCVDELPADHPAVRVMEARRIPRHRWKDYYHAEDFASWSNTLVPGRYSEPGDPRLVIPVWSVRGTLVGYQGRAYDPRARSRYLTAAVDPSEPFLYGWDRVAGTMGQVPRITAVEGPIDSEFVPRGVASAGGKITRELLRTGYPREAFVVAYDNEPRSASTVEKMERAMADDFPVFIWPSDVVEKDFNDLVMKMMSMGSPLELALSRIEQMIAGRTFTGLEAELELAFWKKV